MGGWSVHVVVRPCPQLSAVSLPVSGGLRLPSKKEARSCFHSTTCSSSPATILFCNFEISATWLSHSLLIHAQQPLDSLHVKRQKASGLWSLTKLWPDGDVASVNSRTTESLPDLMLERGEEELRVQQVIEVGLVVLQQLLMLLLLLPPPSLPALLC